MGDFYNTSVESEEMRCIDKTVGCFPKPFMRRDMPAAPPGYTVVIDASVTGVRAQQVLSQLVYGGFMDDTSRSATIQVGDCRPLHPNKSLASKQVLSRGKFMETE